MSLLSEFLAPQNIILDACLDDKDALFQYASDFFQRSAGVSSALVFSSLIEREALASTALGQGVAIPHGRIKSLKRAQLLFLRPNAPVPFGAPDALPVRLFFFLLVPESANEQHLEILSEVAQLLSDRVLRDQLLTLQDSQSIHQLFQLHH
jgi:PTS system nitrogen regulatory IIA component